MKYKLNDNRVSQGTGKTKYNAITHGVLRESITSYETNDYEAFYSELESDINPKSILEKLLIERIVINKVKLDRISKAESELVKQSMDPRIVKPIIINNFEWDIVEKAGYAPKVNFEAISKLDLYSRYQTQAENRMYKAIQMLQGLKY